MISAVLDELGVAVPHDDVPRAHVSSQEEYTAYLASSAPELARRREIEDRLVRDCPRSFTITGLCVNCGSYTDLQVSTGATSEDQGSRPNWREEQICTTCGLNSRTRIALHAAESWLGIQADDAIYLMEQTTPLFRALSSRYSRLTASEYLGSRVARGQTHGGIRNEDATRLTFSNGAFDAILSFEVFEHIPDYRLAFREAARCLRPGGRLIFTVPFVTGRQATLVRARLDPTGDVRHIEPPEYHGDPLSPNGGILCFQHFGWDMFDSLKEAGFETTHAELVWSRQFGYLGDNHLLFVATKGH